MFSRFQSFLPRFANKNVRSFSTKVMNKRSSSFSIFAATATFSAFSLTAGAVHFLNKADEEESVALCEDKKKFKVAIIGAAGGIGQPLSLLMKTSPLVSELRLYDLAPFTPGVAVDLSHINTASSVKGYTGADQMTAALADADLVIIPAGVPRKPGMTRDDLFNINAGIVSDIANKISTACPSAFILVISNPVNSTVPIVAETLKRKGVYNKDKLFGVTTLDVVRANTFVAENQKLSVDSVNVPVIGGHAGITIIPLLSNVHNAKFSMSDVETLTQRIMFGGDEVVSAKAGAGSATLSMAFAGARFAESVLKAANGEKGIVECAYVDSRVAANEGVNFFASPVLLGPNGIATIPSLPVLDEFEEQKLKEAIPELKQAIQKGVEFVNKKQ